MSAKGIKLREFQWFEMETRVRQMVQQLITPFTKRVFESLSGINQLKALTNQEAIKLDEIKKIVTNDPTGKEIDIFRSIDSKQEELRSDVLELENMVSETEKIVERRISIQDQRLEESKGIIMNNMKLKERVSEEIFQQNESIKQLRVELESIVGEIKLVLDKTILDQEEDNKAHKSTQQKLSERIQKLEDHSKMTDENFERTSKEYLLIHSKIIHLEEESYEVKKEIKCLQDNLVYIKRLGNYVKELEERIHKQDFALQHLSPLITQAQLSQTLYSILPIQQKRKLIIYQNQKFSQLNNHILDTDYKKSKQLLFNGTQMLETVQKRNTKEVINMKRKKLISMGIDIDNLNYEAKEKFYKEISLTEDEINEEGDIRVNNGPDENEITGTINRMIELASADFNAKLSQELADSKKYFQHIEDQLQLNLENSIRVVERCTKELTQFKNEQHLVNSNLEKEVRVLDEYRESTGRNVSSLSNSLSTMMQFCTLINHLQIQDQLDKQSISLFGLKTQFAADISNDFEEKKKNVVNLQKQCFSCNGYPATTISAFKMACLAYTPSSIKLDSKDYKRQELLEISTKILHHLKAELEQPSKKMNDSSSLLQTTIKKKALTQPTIEQQSVLSPPKLGRITKIPKFNTTMSNQIRTRAQSKVRKQQSTKKYQPPLFSNVFNQTRKRHSFYLQKKHQLSMEL